MNNWKPITIQTSTKGMRGNSISITMANANHCGYIYFSAGLDVKEGRYRLASDAGLYAFIPDINGEYTIKRNKNSKTATMLSKPLVNYLRDTLKLDRNTSHKFTARVEDNVIIFNPINIKS